LVLLVARYLKGAGTTQEILIKVCFKLHDDLRVNRISAD
jgi:hypothetical protein